MSHIPEHPDNGVPHDLHPQRAESHAPRRERKKSPEELSLEDLAASVRETCAFLKIGSGQIAEMTGISQDTIISIMNGNPAVYHSYYQLSSIIGPIVIRAPRKIIGKGSRRTP